MRANAEWGLFAVRLGIAGVLIWFGSQEILTPHDWTFYVPEWVLPLSPVSADALVLLNGSLEIICGLFILLGVFVRIVALIMAVHIAFIAASLGYTSIGIRDWGLALAALGLALGGGGAWSLPGRARMKN